MRKLQPVEGVGLMCGFVDPNGVNVHLVDDESRRSIETPNEHMLAAANQKVEAPSALSAEEQRDALARFKHAEQRRSHGQSGDRDDTNKHGAVYPPCGSRIPARRR